MSGNSASKAQLKALPRRPAIFVGCFVLMSINLLLSGCAFVPRDADTVLTPVIVDTDLATIEAPPPPPAATVVPTPRSAPARAEPAVAVVSPEPAEPPVVAVQAQHTGILLSRDIPAIAEIAARIRQRLGDDTVSIYDLGGQQSNAARVLEEINRTQPDRIVAIGLLAASVAQALPDTPTVFCQVYNYTDHELLSATSKGVSLLPPFELQLAAWKRLSPNLRSVGVLIGPDQDELLEEIRRASDAEGIELTVRNVQSDKEALFAFKRLTPDIQGIWLLPDNRILSPEVVREILSYSVKHRKQVVVFGTNLLRWGALMSVTSDDGDIAERVLARFADDLHDGQFAGPDMRPLTRLHTTVNEAAANRLGLIVPEQLAVTRSSD
jgi:ABC-type uncharacterized transport system substrate-binding protein